MILSQILVLSICGFSVNKEDDKMNNIQFMIQARYECISENDIASLLIVLSYIHTFERDF